MLAADLAQLLLNPRSEGKSGHTKSETGSNLIYMGAIEPGDYLEAWGQNWIVLVGCSRCR
jgi:hypothetical protein